MRRFGLTTLSVMALCAAPLVGQQYQELLKNDPLLVALTLPRIASLPEVLKSPEAYRGMSVRLVVAFSDHGKLENPFFTRFTTNNYMNFGAWDDNQAIWRKQEYLNSYPLFFVRRGAPVAKQFVEAKRFDRFLVEAIVQDTFRGKPWIEITSARKEESALSMGSLLHLFHASSQAERGNYSLAQGEVGRALQAPLPDHHRVEALALSASIQEHLGDVSGARARWEEVLGFQPTNKVAMANRDRLVALENRIEEGNPLPVEDEVGEMQETPEFLEPPKDDEMLEKSNEATPSPVGTNGAETPSPAGTSGTEPTPPPAPEGGNSSVGSHG